MPNDLEKRLAEWAEKHNDFAGDDVRAILERCARLEREIAEWASKDGNSPGYNRQKAANYGDKAYRLRCERDEARDRCAILEAALREARDAELSDVLNAIRKPPGYVHPDSPLAKDCEQLARHLERKEHRRALLGPSPEGSPPTGLHFPEATPAEMSAAMTSLLGEPPEGTETDGGIRATLMAEAAAVYEADDWQKRVAFVNGGKFVARHLAPSPLHGETEDEARERRERECHERVQRYMKDVGRSYDWTQRDARACFILGAEYEARHLSTRTTPDPECKATPPQGAQMESKTSIAPPVSLPEGWRWGEDSPGCEQAEVGEEGVVWIADGYLHWGCIDCIDIPVVLALLQRAGLLPGATLTEDQRRTAIDLLACARAWEPGVRIVGNVRADDIARLCLSTLGGDE